MAHKHCDSPLTDSEVRDLLTKNGLNRTKVKIQTLMAISKSKRPLSVQEIHASLTENCDVSTVFRTITQFKEKELIQEVNLDEGFLRYELIHHDHHHHEHHHHVRCRKCGDIQSIEHCDLGPFEKAIAKLGFVDMEHRLEFTGVCSKCSRKK